MAKSTIDKLEPVPTITSTYKIFKCKITIFYKNVWHLSLSLKKREWEKYLFSF